VRRRLPYLAASLAAVAVVVWISLERRHELTRTLAHVSPAVFAIAVALHVATLFARADAWRITLLAVVQRPVRWRFVHVATAFGFLAGIAETHLAMPARLAALRRLAPAAAPRVPQMLLSDVPMMALEGCCAAALLVVAAGALPAFPWWAFPLTVACAGGGVVAIRLVHERLAEQPLFDGLAILGAPGLRERLAGLTVTTVVLTLARVAVLLAACRLAPDPAHVVLVYLAVSVLGLLPIGPASNPAATVLASGAPTIGAATAAGLAIAVTSIAGVLIYVVVAAIAASVRRPAAHRLVIQTDTYP
jgi:hypothetical protein